MKIVVDVENNDDAINSLCNWLPILLVLWIKEKSKSKSSNGLDLGGQLLGLGWTWAGPPLVQIQLINYPSALRFMQLG
jgi:hypothetical protein